MEIMSERQASEYRLPPRIIIRQNGLEFSSAAFPHRVSHRSPSTKLY